MKNIKAIASMAEQIIRNIDYKMEGREDEIRRVLQAFISQVEEVLQENRIDSRTRSMSLEILEDIPREIEHINTGIRRDSMYNLNTIIKRYVSYEEETKTETQMDEEKAMQLSTTNFTEQAVEEGSVNMNRIEAIFDSGLQNVKGFIARRGVPDEVVEEIMYRSKSIKIRTLDSIYEKAKMSEKEINIMLEDALSQLYLESEMGIQDSAENKENAKPWLDSLKVESTENIESSTPKKEEKPKKLEDFFDIELF